MSKTSVTDKDGNVSYYIGLGRRKASVARVRLAPKGSGQISINKRPLEEYCLRLQDRQLVLAPLELTGTRTKYDVFVNVNGGGIAGQAGAIRHGLSRALVHAEEAL